MTPILQQLNPLQLIQLEPPPSPMAQTLQPQLLLLASSLMQRLIMEALSSCRQSVGRVLAPWLMGFVSICFLSLIFKLIMDLFSHLDLACSQTCHPETSCWWLQKEDSSGANYSSRDFDFSWTWLSTHKRY